MGESDDSASRNEEDSRVNAEDDPLAGEKARLREEIAELKSLLREVESRMEISKFGDVTTTAASTEENLENPGVNKARKLNVKLELELHRFAGFVCTKFGKGYCTFHLSPANRYDKEHLYAVQILSEGREGSLGKWVMPMTIHLNELAKKIPLKELKNIPAFMKACKHLVNCHFSREQQFKELMDIVSTLKYCNLQANLGYTRITLKLFKMESTNEESFLDIVVYLMYNPTEARPSTIDVDSQGKEELDKETVQRLKTCLKCFKSLELKAAFAEMFNDEQGSFIWKREQIGDSPIPLHRLSYSSTEEEEQGYLDGIENATMLSRKRKTREKLKPRKKMSLSTSQVDENQLTLHETTLLKETVEDAQSASIANASTDKENVKVQQSRTPLHKAKNKSKQTKPKLNSKIGKRSPAKKKGPPEKEARLKQTKLLTSTPFGKNQTLTASTSFEVSDIPQDRHSSASVKAPKAAPGKARASVKGRKRGVKKSVK